MVHRVIVANLKTCTIAIDSLDMTSHVSPAFSLTKSRIPDLQNRVIKPTASTNSVLHASAHRDIHAVQRCTVGFGGSVLVASFARLLNYLII